MAALHPSATQPVQQEAEEERSESSLDSEEIKAREADAAADTEDTSQASQPEEASQPVEEAESVLQKSAEPSPPASHKTVTTFVVIEGIATPMENPADADVIRGPCDICRELCVPV
jgi:hypothetical protein